MAIVSYKFKVGQTVDLIPSVSRLAANGHYQIVSRRPSEGEIPQYRIKSMRELHERVVAENELTLLENLTWREGSRSSPSRKTLRKSRSNFSS